MAHLAIQKPTPLTVIKAMGKRWAPSLSIWGVGIGTAALFLLSVTPVVKNGLLVKLPVIGNYYEDKTPPSDKPF
ncbi:ubiquinol-cytochrome-c reductase complex subunit-domain-containing protein [Melanogaster broomeanus]|nr:ubiquinol-cytochrome-c reductase complex subunit-domain-containing protein [Melanogaster broomeanus]